MRALMLDPELLLLDEPLGALDPLIRADLQDVLRRIFATLGKTVLLVTHDTGAIGQHASKMLYLDKTVLFFGSFEEFCHSPEMSSLFGEHSQHLMCHRH